MEEAKRSAKATIPVAVLAVIVGFPAGWIAAMMLTPVLWKLEPVLHMELAGHSGPSDWVFYVIWGIFIPALYLVFRQIAARMRSKSRL